MNLKIEDDFDLYRIADSGQCFRWEDLSGGVFRVLNGAYCLYVESLGNKEYSFSCGDDEFKTVWWDYFDLSENYAGIRTRIDQEEDPFLWRAAQQEQGIRILRQDPWEMLITFIISQNKNIPAIRRSVEMICECCGEEKLDCRGKAYHAFPDPVSLAALGEKELKDCRLGYRWSYVHEAAEAVAAGNLSLEGLRNVNEEATIRDLMALKGVGIKVASCVSLFGLHHVDAFPQDVWVKRVIENEYPQGYPFERYSPYNGIYQQYMFAYYRNK